MRLLEKVIAGGPERHTRLHTRRGDLAPISEALKLPGLLARRFRADVTGPWMARGAVDFLEQTLRWDTDLLELGSGASTKWFADRVRAVVCVEPDPEWGERTRADTVHCQGSVELVV